MHDVTPLPPAGWYPDPNDSSQRRWWDGSRWTEQVPASAQATTAAPYTAEPYTAEPLSAPAGTNVNTPWIWLISIIMILPMLPMLFIDWGAMFHYDYSPMSAANTQLAFLFSPAYLLATVGGWVAYGLGVLLAFLDWRELRRRGVPRPFHFAWTFLSYLVYVIGRSVVVKNRTDRPFWGPVWVAVAGVLLSFVLVGWIMVSAISAIISTIPSF